jgi:hypothetical protein
MLIKIRKKFGPIITSQDRPGRTPAHFAIHRFEKLHGRTALSDSSVAGRMSMLLAWPHAAYFKISSKKYRQK